QGTRELIMAAATELFAARGVTSTSIDDIAEAAGIAKGSIYYNFESKAGLVEAIMARSSELLGARLERASAGRKGADLQAAVVRELLELLGEHPATAQVMAAELFRTERSWRESIQTWRALALATLISDLEADGVESGRARLRAAAIVGAALTAGLEWLVFHPDLPAEQVSAAVLESLGLG
ncbi:MAG: TetR family transcriptional regulator, partial [Actinobacteria bacterium]|nr:TetR family transcriptional regulator [Actinomycetota bacterium]